MLGPKDHSRLWLRRGLRPGPMGNSAPGMSGWMVLVSYLVASTGLSSLGLTSRTVQRTAGPTWKLLPSGIPWGQRRNRSTICPMKRVVGESIPLAAMLPWTFLQRLWLVGMCLSQLIMSTTSRSSPYSS